MIEQCLCLEARISMQGQKEKFSIYLSELAVELRNDQSEYFGNGRLICRQSNYDSLLRFAKKLAGDHHLPLWNYTHLGIQYQYDY